jgi:hypothetical protein
MNFTRLTAEGERIVGKKWLLENTIIGQGSYGVVYIGRNILSCKTS